MNYTHKYLITERNECVERNLYTHIHTHTHVCLGVEALLVAASKSV